MARLSFVLGCALVSLVASLSLKAVPVEQPLLKPDPEGIFCRYKNYSLTDACLDGGVCAIKNLTSASDVCEEIFRHDHVVELPFLSTNFTTPYIPVPGCPAVAVDHLHIPLAAFRTGNRYRSTVCTLTCGKFCERIADHEGYKHGHLWRTMVPLCYCKHLINHELEKIAPETPH
eukprot:c39290_g1_i1.p2 GENE.c39290_g1_i1~~c39290_g1_i1.p2  ORF type:complete len:185 (+),score=35.81 c39290_g1_i1:36-557(+)